MKKLLALLLAVVMVLALVACAPVEDPKNTTAATTPDKTDAPTTTEDVGVEFPLKEEMTIVLCASPRGSCTNPNLALANNKLWQELYKATNVKIEFLECQSIETLNAMMNVGQYGDIIMLNGMSGNNEAALSDLINNGKLMPIEEYVTNEKIMPNFVERVLGVEKYALSSYTSPDGHLYVMGSHNEDDSNYLESSLWINKTWLEDAGMTLEDVATIEGLEKFFDWVAKNDANGNGDTTDELPFLCYQMGSNFIEALLGMWGIPTKDQTNEGYIFLEDGEVKFAPLTENWVDFMTTMTKWFQNGWAYKDYLLGHDGDGKPLYEYRQNTYVRDNGEPERIAFWAGTGAPARNAGTKLPGVEMCEYVSILPPKVEGYETRWYLHPGGLGLKGNFAISANCENPEIALAWMDQFYSLEVYCAQTMGDEDSPYHGVDAEGKLFAVSVTNDIQAEIINTDKNVLNQVFAGWPTAITLEDYETTLATTAAIAKKRAALELYKDVINTEVWSRPYYTKEDSATLSETFGEVALVVKQYRADVLTGKKNLTTDYEQFKKDLETARLDELLEVMQNAHDVYLDALPE